MWIKYFSSILATPFNSTFKTSYLDVVGTLVPALANLLTNKTDVVGPVAAGLALDVLGEGRVHLGHAGVLGHVVQGAQVQPQVPAQVQVTLPISVSTLVLRQSLGNNNILFFKVSSNLIIIMN